MSDKCTLIADDTDDAVQLLLGFVALSSLYAKWHFEAPRRPAQVWFMDAMKQGTSAAMVHVLNILFSIGIVGFSDRPSDEDEVRVRPGSFWTAAHGELICCGCDISDAVRFLLYERRHRHDARRVHSLFIGSVRHGACGNIPPARVANQMLTIC